MGIPLRVLIVEDSADDAELVVRQLRRAGYDPVSECVQTADAMQAALEREAWDLVVSDYTMPQFTAPTALNLLNQSGRDVPFIVVSGSIGEDIAVAMMKTGAHDYLLKQNLARFVPAVERELREAANRRQQRLTEHSKQRLQIERDELLERLKQENEDLAALTQVTANAISTLDLDELLRVLLGRVLEVMRADAATILLAERAELRVRASAGAVDLSDTTEVVLVGKGFAGSVASRKQPVYVEDAALDPLITDPLIRERGIRSMLGVPLKRNGLLIGVLHVDWLTLRPCRDREVHLLEITAERCAAAIQNAQLYQEARRIAAVLTESEARLRRLSSAIEQTADAVMITDQEGTIQYVNTAFEGLTGYSTTEVVGRKPSVLKSGQHPPEFYEQLWQTINAGVPFRAVCINRHKNGALIYEAMTITPIKDDRGDITHFVSTAKDLTDERRQAEELRESEERFRQLAEHINEVFWITDPAQNKIIYVSPAYEKVWGRTRVSLGVSSHIWLDAIHPEDRERIIPSALTKQAIGTYDEEYRIVRPDGTIRWIHDRAFPVRNQTGEVYRIVGVAQDVTERLKAEEDAREAFATLNTTADGAFIFDPDTLRFSYVNEGAVRHLGYSREEFMQMTALDIKPQFGESYFRGLIAPLQTGTQKVFSFTTTQRRKDGTVMPVDVNLQYVTSPGRRPRFVAIARDITERKRLEVQLLRTQRMESIGTLASGVAHDLNNALAPILMATELLRLEFPEKASGYLEMIQASARHGADMVKQLLTFAKGVEGERLLLQPRHLLKEMEKLIRSTFPKNIQLRTDYAKDLRTILGDATQLHQVLLNLCVNARDAMPEGGTLTLKAEIVEWDTLQANAVQAKPGQYVVWRVTDTGTGIAPEILERIFEPFFSTKGPDKGTGLGLSTVIGIVKSHDGVVQVYSTPGQGSTFAIYLPASGPTTADTSLRTKTDTSFRGHGETILVVDDEVAVRNVLRDVLTKLNFKVLTAADGTAALVQLAENRADLRVVITDLHMPHMDGLAFVRVLKGRLPHTGIIVVSGRVDDPEGHEIKKLGVNAVLEKPFMHEKLVEALKTVFAK